MNTYGGCHVTREFGAPSIRDIAVQSMRLCRFAGASGVFYPVGVHLLLVADLLPLELEHHGLLHDAAEVCVNDVPRPMKTKGQRAVEHRVLRRIYHALGLSLPTPEQDALIHAADIRAVNVEGVSIAGSRGFAETQPGITEDKDAMVRLCNYLANWNPLEAITPEGKWPTLLERRLRIAVTRVHNSASYRNGYTKPA
jgi:hypothetical protein